jgi:hypothetical protein
MPGGGSDKLAANAAFSTELRRAAAAAASAAAYADRAWSHTVGASTRMASSAVSIADGL